MSKIRNSLGALVLPALDGIYTFKQYKEKTGIDLSKIFVLDEDDLTILNPDFSKILYLRYITNRWSQPIRPANLMPDPSSNNLIVFSLTYQIDGGTGSVVNSTPYGLKIDALDQKVSFYEL